MPAVYGNSLSSSTGAHTKTCFQELFVNKVVRVEKWKSQRGYLMMSKDHWMSSLDKKGPRTFHYSMYLYSHLVNLLKLRK